MEIVIKNKTITDNFKKAILEEVDKHIDKYLQGLGINDVEQQSAMVNVNLKQNREIVEEIIPSIDSVRNYLKEFVNNTHARNFEFSLIL